MIRGLHPMKSMASKTITALLIVILIPTIFISVLFYVSASSIVKQNVRQSSLQLLKQAADSLSSIWNVGSDISDMIYSDTTIQKLVLKETYPDFDINTARIDPSYITNTLNNITYSNSFIKMAYVLRESGHSWGSGNYSQTKVNSYVLSDLPWIRQAQAHDGTLCWAELQYDKFSGAGGNVEFVIPAVRTLKDFRTMKTIGYIVVQVDGKAVLNKISELRIGKTSSFFVVNQDGIVMIHKDISLIGKEIPDSELRANLISENNSEFEYRSENRNYYGVKQTLTNGWIIAGVVPTQELTGQLDRLRSSIFKWSIGLFILAVGIGLWSARKITQPIGRLTRQMKLVEEGNLQVRTAVESSDEIGQLSKQFNTMIQKVEQLMQQITEEQSNKRKAELRAVTHQINPHFMVNTLNTIRWLIKFGDQDKAYKGITDFNQLMEANMGKKGMMVTVREELDTISKYLEILQLRYSLTFTLNMTVDPGAWDFTIPRMLLQPIVENAIFHGIVPRGQDGEILISVQELPGFIFVAVKDNGIGMSEKQIQTFTELKYGDSFEGMGIGLKHVFECINLYFPAGSGWFFHSKPNIGTVVQLKLMKSIIPTNKEEQARVQGNDR